jgi:peptidoglycan/LPS O-acetylase OafA/YrhL
MNVPGDQVFQGRSIELRSTRNLKGTPIYPHNRSYPAERWPALDGLRGLAILLVFAFHLPLPIFRTGSYGVIFFFVLSGFLITTILLRGLDRQQRLELRWFYGRRAARLLPALLVLIAGHLILQLTVLGEPEQWWDRTWPVLTYLANVVMVGDSGLVHMSHTWSLAIEEHFYLLWPLVLLVVPARWRLRVSWGLAALLACWRLLLLGLGADNIRVFFATDTNAFALLLGCALAISYAQGRLSSLDRTASAMSVTALILASTLPWEFSDRRLLYGAVPVALVSVAAVWSALRTPTGLLRVPILRWFGRISYGLYLWHFVLISMPWERLPLPPIVPMVAIPIAAAAASYYWIESPVLRWWHRLEARHRSSPVSWVAGDSILSTYSLEAPAPISEREPVASGSINVLPSGTHSEPLGSE